MNRELILIGVIGAGICGAEIAEIAEATGRELARRGAVLVCGGLGGVMEAACRGAKSAGGTTVGLLPGVSPLDANPYIDIPIATGLGEARNVLIAQSTQALIAIAGEYGTLSEIGHALKLGKPVVGLQTWELYRGGRLDPGIRPASTAEEADELAVTLGRELIRRGLPRLR